MRTYLEEKWERRGGGPWRAGPGRDAPPGGLQELRGQGELTCPPPAGRQLPPTEIRVGPPLDPK